MAWAIGKRERPVDVDGDIQATRGFALIAWMPASTSLVALEGKLLVRTRLAATTMGSVSCLDYQTSAAWRALLKPHRQPNRPD
jgi:hypothetical protein